MPRLVERIAGVVARLATTLGNEPRAGVLRDAIQIRTLDRELAWTDASEAHIGRHQVTPAEVEEVVNTRPRWEHPGVEGPLLVYGQTVAGRYLLAVLAESMDGRWYVATARDQTATEARTFREKGR